MSNGNIRRYTKPAIAFHWLIAVLVLGMIGLGWYMGDIPRGTPDRTFFFNLHKSIGVTTAILVLIRLWWRWKNPPPLLPAFIPAWQAQASRISHSLLYLCLILMPLSGFSASQFTKYGVTYFGLFKIRPMGWENKEIYSFLQGIHGVTATLLVVLVAVHILAALKHLLINRDGVFQRMLPGK
jgi:cytochrome b561